MIRLGMRLTFAGGRGALVRLALMSAGVALGVALLLTAAALPSGFARRSERADRRDWPREPATPNRSHLLWAVQHLNVADGRKVTAIAVASRGPRPPRPLGAERVPAPGTALVSPELARILADPAARRAVPALSARVVGRLGQAALTDPRELVVMTGWDYDALRAASPSAARVDHFRPSGDDAGLRIGLTFFGVLGGVVVLIPVLLAPVLAFVGSTARVGARQRGERLAAMRLVGATPGQVRAVAAVEATVAAVLGVGGGLIAAWAARAVFVSGGRLFAADFTPDPAVVAAVAVVTPVLAVASAMLALRRVEVSPLGVSRRRRTPPVTRWRWLPLALGWVLVALGASGRSWAGPWVAVLNTIGCLSVALGVVRVGPRMLQGVATLLARAARRPGTLVAARRLQADPRAAFRPGAAVGLSLFGLGLIAVLLPSLDRREQDRGRPFERSKQGQAIFAALGLDARGPDLVVNRSSRKLFSGSSEFKTGTSAAVVDALSSVPGVEAVAPIYRSVEPAGASPSESLVGRVVVADCATFARTLRTISSNCRAGALIDDGLSVLTPPSGTHHVVALQALDGHRMPFLVTSAGGLPLLSAERFMEQTESPEGSVETSGISALLPPELVPREARASGEVTEVLLRTDGTPATVRRVAAVVAAKAPGMDVLRDERRLDERFFNGRHAHNLPGGYESPLLARFPDSFRSFLYAALVFMLVVGACSLTVTGVDGLLDRRRPLATLRAIGTPASTLRRAATLEAVAPLLVAAVLGAANGAAAGVLLAWVMKAPLTMRWLDLATVPLILALVLAAVVIATAAAASRVRSAALPRTP